jgi:hypothetical protein
MIAILLAAQIVSSAPPLSPEEAARILARSPGLSNWANRANLPPAAPDGPTVTVIDSSPTAGPFGEFEAFPEPRRLDGTLLSQPPDWYYPSSGSWLPYPYAYGYSYGSTFGRHDAPRFNAYRQRTGQGRTHQVSPLEVVRPMQRFAPGGAPPHRPASRGR